ncbi:MAG: type IV pilus secretin PilQ, partial [Elusimicrobia bacterium]|nr:type IV pilus secretin PilQ [Elusimicrobiota bacterium]
EYSSFLTGNPERLVLQFENTRYSGGTLSLPGQGRYLERVRAAQFKTGPRPVARVVLDLARAVGFDISRSGSDLLVTLNGPPQTGAVRHPPVRILPAVKPKPAPTLSEVGETGGMTTRPSADLRRMAAADSARPKGAAASPPRTKAHDSADRASIEPRRDIMSRLPRDLISVDFDNTDIKDVIRLLAAKAKLNIVFGPDISGTLTLHLHQVPFPDAFRTILTMMGLATMQVGDNILRVLTPAALKESQTAAASVTKVIPLNYAKAAELLPTINAVRTAEGRPGIALADSKTNSLIVTESVEGLADTERLVSELDVRPKQVLIEAKLVEVSLNNSLDYGVQWDYASFEPGHLGGKQGLTTIGAPVGPATANAITLPNDQHAATSGFATGTLPGATARGTGVNLPASQIFGALTLGRVTNTYFLNATLTAAAAHGKVKVLSDPKIATLNNQPAKINVTTQIPYVTANVASTGVQTQAVNYVTTGIELSVTPSINADGRITLLINPTVSQPSATAAGNALTGAPAVDSRDASTTVLVRDGETIVIGGLIADSTSDTIAKIPILGDIPILGWLFKKKSVSRTRSELLIFVTPKIMVD